MPDPFTGRFDPYEDLPAHDKDGRPRLEVGQLLLTDEDPRRNVWCVSKVFKTKAKVVMHYGGMFAEADLTTPYLPDGWCVLPYYPALEALTRVAREAEMLKDAEEHLAK